MEILAAFWNSLLDGSLQWRSPVWLWGALVPPLLWGLGKLWVRHEKQRYAQAHLWPWVQAQQSGVAADPGQRSGAYWKRIVWRTAGAVSPGRVLTVAWLCLLLAMAGPRAWMSQNEQTQRAGVDLLVLLDLSQSMQTEDVYPNRFLHAKAMLESVVKGLQANDRVGLMAFAGQPHLVTPLSFDRNLFAHGLNLLEPGLLPMQGTWLELAVLNGWQHLRQTAGKAQVLMVLTDGAPPFWQPQVLPEAVRQWPVYSTLQQGRSAVNQAVANGELAKTVWVGIGQTLPAFVPDKEHKSGWLYVNGIRVQSRLEESVLQQWAQKTAGVYLHASTDAAFLKQLLEEITLPAQSRSLPDPQGSWQDFSRPFRVLGLLGLLWAFYPLGVKIGTRALTPMLAMAGVVLGMGVLGWVPGTAQADAPNTQALNQQAYQALMAGDNAMATELYDRLANFEGWFGAGVSTYQAGDLASAVLYFRQAAQQAGSDHNRARALFNLGNSYYQANLLPQAIESFEQALLYWPGYEKAQSNLLLAQQRAELERAAQKAARPEEDESHSDSPRDNEGAFYGGQKPNPAAVSGGDSDQQQGQGEAAEIELQAGVDVTDYRFDATSGLEWQKQQPGGAAVSGQAIVAQQARQRRAEQFVQKMQTIEDRQSVLLQRMFEREAGFQAAQEQPHSLPGVQPW
jgi:Ca-activated chloride channel family protein